MKTPIKIVLVLLLSVMTFFSCSKDDDNDDNVGSVRTELVGSWSSDNGLLATLNSDGTGFTSDIFALEVERIKWGATSNILTLDYIDSEDFEEIPYKLINNNTFSVTLTDEDTNEDFDVVFYRQLDNNVDSVRTELVGSWYSSYVGEGFTLYSDGTGFNDEDGQFTWGATSSVISIIFEYDEELEKYSYKLIDNNTLRVTLNDPETDEDVDVVFERLSL